MVVDATKKFLNKFTAGASAKTDPSTSPIDKSDSGSGTSPVSRALKERTAKAPKPVIQLNIDSHEKIADLKEVENKSAQKVLKFYEFGKDGSETEAFTSADKNELLVKIPSEIAARKITNGSFFKKIFSAFSKFKVNSALTRLKENGEIDLISADNEVTNPKLLQQLTKAGVYSFVAIHKADEKGNYGADAELLVPVMDLHNMLEYLKTNPPKSIPKAMLEAFKAELEKLEADPKLQNVKFIDEALAKEVNKAQYEGENELRKVLCTVTDALSHDAEVLVSSDLIGKGDLAEAHGKSFQAIDYNFPVIAEDGSVAVVEHPLTRIVPSSRKSETLPPSINTVLNWHFLVQSNKNTKMEKNPEAVQEIQTAFRKNAEAIKAFDDELSPPLKAKDKGEDKDTSSRAQAA